MRIIDHTRHALYKRRPKKNWLVRYASVVTVLLVVVYSGMVGVRYALPVPSIKPQSKNVTYTPTQPAIVWPTYGQSAVGELEAGVLASSVNQSPRPIASVTKMMTALAILRQKPLKKGETGPMITLSSSDVRLYDEYLAKDGSVVSVRDGEQISQYQALQAMLLPSANNMADSTARWAFGSLNEYIQYANTLATSLGMTQTTIADASGFSPSTVSTAHDVILLGQAALQEPVLAEIVGQSTATIPVHGEVRNVNTLLGTEGINGIKTGNTDEAGGCFLVSAVKRLANGEQKTLLAAVLGAPLRARAMTDSMPLLTAASNNYRDTVVVTAGQTVGYYTTEWGDNVAAVAQKDLRIFGWTAAQYKLSVSLDSVHAPQTTDTKVGRVTVNEKTSVDVVLQHPLTPVPTAWRLQRAYQL